MLAQCPIPLFLLFSASLFAQIHPPCSYTLQHAPGGSIIVFRNAVALEESAYTRTGSGGLRTITMNSWNDGDRLMFYYSAGSSINVPGTTPPSKITIYLPTKEYFTCPGVAAGDHFTLSAAPTRATVGCVTTCRARIGEQVFAISGNAFAENLTGDGSTSTVWFYIDPNGNPTFGYDGAAVTGATLTGLIPVSGVQNYPPNTIPIGQCSVSGNQFGTCTDDRAELARTVIDASFGIVAIQDPVTGHSRLSVNPAILPTVFTCQGAGSGPPPWNCEGMELLKYTDGKSMVATIATPEALALPMCPVAQGACWQPQP